MKQYLLAIIYLVERGILLNYIGIDIGSTASKVGIRGEKEAEFVIPSGWNSVETALKIKDMLKDEYGIDVEGENSYVVSTGYGRVSVPYSDKEITEITCHGRGAIDISGYSDCTVIDIGGQDTKVIQIQNSMVTDFIMNDKCSAGTGRFLEIMASRLGVTLQDLFAMAKEGEVLKISSMCTVFAESEIIGLMGQGEDREDIAAGIVDSVLVKVIQLAERKGIDDNVVLTGGLALNDDFVKMLSEQIGKEVFANEKSHYAGAIGAAILGKKQYEKQVQKSN